MEILRVENLTKVYGKGENEVRALDGVSFSVEKGEFVAIIGPSGSGKSTLLHILGAVDEPSSGKVFMDGKDVFKQNEEQLAIFRRRQVGLVYQFYNLIPVLDVVENITLPVQLDGRKVNRERLREMVALLGLHGREKHLPNQLSGGQQQRVLLARALCATRKILLLDEPVSGLDPQMTEEMYRLIEKINREDKITIIMISHDIRGAMEYASHILQIGQEVIFESKENYLRAHTKRRTLENTGGKK